MTQNKIIITSAKQMGSPAVDKLVSALAKRYDFAADDYSVESKIDPKLESGFTIKVNNDFYDYSLLGKLKNLAGALYSSDVDLDDISKEALRDMLFNHNQFGAGSVWDLTASKGSLEGENGDKNVIEPHAKTFSTSAFAKESSLYAKLLLAKKVSDLSDDTQNKLSDIFDNQKQEMADVLSVSDGIAKVRGLKHCVNGEMIIFNSGAIGLAMNLEKDEIGVVLLNLEDSVQSGSSCKGSGQVLSVPCGNAFLGRVIDPLGRPLDHEQHLQATHYRPIEYPAPAIIDRKQVKEPLYTGVTAIDSMIPIGKGQRELIIGDRQTGKSTIAIDTILNQKGKNVICIYVAIGQKMSTVKSQVALLRARGAMAYTIVVAASASVSAAMQYIAPYAACAMAEEYMYENHQDVLVIYDDLSKHAQAYRAISLLLHRPPGREAYPGDVFYIHSRLLERAACLSDNKGGGSITAIPIVETQSGDISAYIPTNVISITDGQIYLESDLFFAGQRPAINVGLSVSRVGGSCQAKSMRKAAGPLRVSMAQFRELQAFSQLSGEMDATTAQQIARGQRLNEILKQSEHLNRSMALSLLLISLCTNAGFDEVPVKDLRHYIDSFSEYLIKERSDVLTEFENIEVVTDLEINMLKDIFNDFYHNSLSEKQQSDAAATAETAKTAEMAETAEVKES